MSAPRRAVIYVRLSKYRGTEDPSTSPERQEEACRQQCAAQGWDVVDVVKDLDVSGSDRGLRLDRPGLQSIVERFDDIDVVVFLKIDRLARSVVDFSTFAADAKSHGVDLVSVRDGLDLTTPSGRFVAQILAAFAEMEAAAIGERVRDGIRSTRSSGRFMGGSPPYGYTSAPNPNGPGRVLEIEPTEAAFIREVARRVLSGESLMSISRWANGPEGASPRRTDKWSRIALRVVLTGNAIEGRSVWRIKATKSRPARVEPVVDETGQPVLHPAILDRDTCATLRAVLTPKPGTPHRGRKPARLLSGLVRCGSCGAKLEVARRTNKSTIYKCAAGYRRADCPRSVSITADDVERFVTDKFLASVGDLPAFVRRTEVTGAGETAAANDRKTAALADLADPALNPDDRDRAYQELQSALADHQLATSAPKSSTTRLVPTGKTNAETWADSDTETCREILSANLSVLTINPGAAGRRRVDTDRIVFAFATPHLANIDGADQFTTGRAVANDMGGGDQFEHYLHAPVKPTRPGRRPAQP